MAVINKNVTTTVSGGVGTLTFNYSLTTTNSSPTLLTINPNGISGSNANPNLAVISYSNSFQFFNDNSGVYKYQISNVILDNSNNCSYTAIAPISLTCDMCNGNPCPIAITTTFNNTGGTAPYDTQAERKLKITPIGGSVNKSYSWTITPAFPTEIQVTGELTDELTYGIYTPYFVSSTTYNGEIPLGARTITVTVTDEDSSGLCTTTRTYIESSIKSLPPQFGISSISNPILGNCTTPNNTYTITWDVLYANASNSTLYTCIVPFGGGTPLYSSSAVVNGSGAQTFTTTLLSTGLQYTIIGDTVSC